MSSWEMTVTLIYLFFWPAMFLPATQPTEIMNVLFTAVVSLTRNSFYRERRKSMGKYSQNSRISPETS